MLRDERAGGTPLIDVDGVLVKLECLNPTGSVKDRVAHAILTKSRQTGLLDSGQPIVEATSGNTGIAMAHFGRRMGHPVTIVMPENMTKERKERIRALGADLVLCSAKGSFAEAAEVRDRLAADRGWFNPDQFSNPINPECHRRTTGAELLSGGIRIDAFVAGVGTGGTLIGVGAAVREAFPKAGVVAVEPIESAVMSGGSPGPHGIFGIGDGFVPAIATGGTGGLHPLISDIELVGTAEALAGAEFLRSQHGLCVGVSSGANFVAAKRLQARFESVATVFADGYAKYRSVGLCASADGRCAFQAHCQDRCPDHTSDASA